MDARRHWIRFGLAAAAVLVALGVVTAIVVSLEADATRATAQRATRERLKEAMWRLDAFVVPVLGRQAAFAYSHYVPAFVPPKLFTAAGADNFADGTRFEISPILTSDWPAWVSLHFQVAVDGKGRLASPEVPSGQFAWVAEKRGMSASTIAAKRAALAKLGKLFDGKTRRRLADRGVARSALPRRAALQRVAVAAASPRNDPQLRRRYFNRGQNQVQDPELAGNAMLNTGARPRATSLPLKLVKVQVSDVTAAWIPSKTAQKRTLILYRIATVDGRRLIQGSVLDWPALRRSLGREVKDLFSSVELFASHDKSVRPTVDLVSDRMSTLPVTLSGRLEAIGTPSAFTPVRIALAIGWLVALLALFVVGAAVRSLADLAERRMSFVSAVSHELRAPLTAFRMYLDMLADGMISDEEQKQETLRSLQGQAERLSGLVRGVLDYSRLERQSFRAHGRSLAVRDLCEQVIAVSRDRCRVDELELELEDALGSEGEEIETDPEAVVQVVLNLVDNACKHVRGEHGLGQVRLAIGAADGELFFRVADDGPGVPAKAKKKLFRAFYRAGSEMTREQTGVGLGLAISQGFAGALGGRLSFDGEPLLSGNLSAIFTLRLPLPASHNATGA